MDYPTVGTGSPPNQEGTRPSLPQLLDNMPKTWLSSFKSHLEHLIDASAGYPQVFGPLRSVASGCNNSWCYSLSGVLCSYFLINNPSAHKINARWEGGCFMYNEMNPIEQEGLPRSNQLTVYEVPPVVIWWYDNFPYGLELVYQITHLPGMHRQNAIQIINSYNQKLMSGMAANQLRKTLDTPDRAMRLTGIIQNKKRPKPKPNYGF